jgi:transposase
LKDIGVKIGLFFTGWKHAGENLDELLEERSAELTPPIQECDALSRNVPKNHTTQLGNCLAHLRRKFYELVDVWPQEVARIIGEFASIFANEHAAPQNDEERLKWHQENSSPIMEGIKKYCNNLVEGKKVEPNSSPGKTIAYLNNHWEAFTLFLRIPGVPLTNNDAERLIKRAVLNRKNAYFFRNETGAKIADILMSTMETCVLNNVNPYNFLIAVQKHEEDVRRNPLLWVPWLYEERFKNLQAILPQSQSHPP